MGVGNHVAVQAKRVGIDDFKDFVKNLYVEGMSGNEISEYFKEKHSISVSARHITSVVGEYGLIRSKKESKFNAIKRGRMVYIKKPEHEKYRVKSISAKRRFEVLTRDGYKCKYCGQGPDDGATLEIHHIDGPESTPDGLQTLCFRCHRGVHYTERE